MRSARVGILAAVLLGAAACGGGGATSSAPPASSAPTSSAASAPPTTTPSTTGAATGKKIVVIYLENHNYSAIEGQPCCPYETALSHQGILFTNFFGVAYPSKPNYLAFGGGSTFGQAGSDNPLPLITAQSVFGQMSVAGIDWKAWAENYPGGPGNCYLQPTASNYAMRHVAPLLFADVGQTALCDRVSATEPTTLPQFLWVTPNMCNDDHDCPPASGDAWLGAHVPAWLAQGAEVFITYDTGNPDTTHGGGHVYAVLVGKGIAPARNGTLMDHTSALAGVENAFGLPLLGAAKTAKPIPF
jgi:phosphatidylinositol-3-phosphatase